MSTRRMWLTHFVTIMKHSSYLFLKYNKLEKSHMRRGLSAKCVCVRTRQRVKITESKKRILIWRHAEGLCSNFFCPLIKISPWLIILQLSVWLLLHEWHGKSEVGVSVGEVLATSEWNPTNGISWKLQMMKGKGPFWFAINRGKQVGKLHPFSDRCGEKYLFSFPSCWNQTDFLYRIFIQIII